MAIDIVQKSVTGFDKELLLVGEGYVARPVTVDKTTISGLTADDDGHYVIPQGTYLYGANGSLLDNPQQIAVAATVTDTRATGTIGSTVKVTSKLDGNVADTVALTVGTKKVASVRVVTGNTNAITVELAVDKSGSVTTSYAEVIELLNGDMVANTFIIAEPVANADVTAMAAADSVTLSGGAVGTVTGDIDGVLYHSVDVTNGEATGAMIISGYIDSDKMPVTPSAAVKAKLPRIVFGRKD